MDISLSSARFLSFFFKLIVCFSLSLSVSFPLERTYCEFAHSIIKFSVSLIIILSLSLYMFVFLSHIFPSIHYPCRELFFNSLNGDGRSDLISMKSKRAELYTSTHMSNTARHSQITDCAWSRGPYGVLNAVITISKERRNNCEDERGSH